MCLSILEETYNIKDPVKKPYLFLKQEIIHVLNGTVSNPVKIKYITCYNT